MMLEHLERKKESNNFFFTSVVSGLDICIDENNEYSTDTFSSVVAAWNANQNDPGSNLFYV